MNLTHINQTGKITMVDVSAKPETKRTAVARGKILLKKETIELLQKGLLKKGDALACARVAGISGAKRTWDLIPLCHNILIDQVQVDFQILEDGIVIEAKAVCTGKTGLEMEALTAVSIAALTLYDMCKAVDKRMCITDVRLIAKNKERLK